MWVMDVTYVISTCAVAPRIIVVISITGPRPMGAVFPRLKPMEGLQHKCCSIVRSIGPLFSTFPLAGTRAGEVRSYSHGQNYAL